MLFRSVSQSRYSVLSHEVLEKLDDVDWLTEQVVTNHKCFREIAAELGIEYQAVAKRAAKIGLKSTVGSVKFSPEQRAKLSNRDWLESQLRTDHFDFRNLAEEFGTSLGTVKKWYVNQGIDISAYENSKFPVHIINKLNDKDWLYEQHVSLQKPLLQIATEMGLCNTCPTNSGALSAAFRKHGLDVVRYEAIVTGKQIGRAHV